VEEVNIEKVQGATDAILNDLGTLEVTDRQEQGLHSRWTLIFSPSNSAANWMQPFTNFEVGPNVNDDTCSDIDAVVDFFEGRLRDVYGSVERSAEPLSGPAVARWRLGTPE
jgi:hypothetical protein